MHIHLFHELDIGGRPHGCSYIRLLQPFDYLAKAGKVTVTSGETLPHETPDIAIIERLWLPGLRVQHAENLLEMLAARHIPMVYTLDDNLLDLNVMPGTKDFPTDEQRQIIRLLAQEARRVMVSTAPLAERMRRFNPNISIVPNQLDERMFARRAQRQQNSKITFGYMGTLSHLEDVLMILAPLRKILHTHRDRVQFEILGIAEPQRIESLFDGLPVKIHRLTRKQIEYPGFVQWIGQHIHWDFAIAPLIDTPFNNSKSDLKVLDYGILGIPGIFSDTPSYRHTIRHSNNGLCVPNTDTAWENALQMMIEDNAARRSMAKVVEEEIWNTRTLAQHAQDWEQAVSKIE